MKCKIDVEVIDKRSVTEVIAQFHREGYAGDVEQIVQRYEPTYKVKQISEDISEEKNPNSQRSSTIEISYISGEPVFTVELFIDPFLQDVYVSKITKCNIKELGEERYNLIINKLRKEFGTIEEEICEEKHFPKNKSGRGV